ncbi:MAG: hypothetical protein BRD23_06170 [Halobacteriales archaeon SW_9_67_25]|jgi:putative flippase GtrA|nr:MAG: hypothetical protein BRD23_06170 [Halobacteriales archaeon SW_9_67_25]
MRLENRWGSQVDAVPFAVVALTGLATCYSFGPVYLLTFGVAVPSALAASTGAYALVIVGAYYRLVWTYRPEHRSEVPVWLRFRRLLLAMMTAVGLLALLALPLLVDRLG